MPEVADGPGIGLPSKYRRNAWIIVGLLIVCGSVVSIVCKDWGWLARFGAIVTVAAAISGSFNTSLESKFVIDLLDETFDPSERIYESIKEKPHLYGISRPLTEAETRDIIHRERKRMNAELRGILEKEMRGAVAELELQIGSLGAFIWGFADLLNLI